MSSFFRVRPSAAGAGAGGKILRGRRVLPSSSPYRRPMKPSSPADISQPESATWFSGVISGAGKLISSVFRSHSPSPTPSSSYSSSDDDDESADVFSKEPDQPLQIVKELEPVKDCCGTSLAIISKIESKHVIEQLLVQETFSRDEGNRLIKIIESRVLELGDDGIRKDIINGTAHNDIAYPQTWNSSSHSRKLPEAVPYSFASIHTISPSGRQVFIPKQSASAVTESKKQLEDKMPASSAKVGFDIRSCNLKTSSLQYDFGDEEGSPVDMAKSYMRTLPPWRSPSSSSVKFERTTHGGMPLYKDEIRRVQPNLADNNSDDSIFKPVGSHKRYSKDEALKSSAAKEIIGTDLSKVMAWGSRDASADLPACCINDHSTVHVVPDERTAEVNHLARAINTISPDFIKNTQEAVNTIIPSETSSLVTLPSGPNPIGGEPELSDPASPISYKNQDVKEPLQVKEQVDNSSRHCNMSDTVSKPVEHVADYSLLNPEIQTLRVSEINSIASDVEAVNRLDNVNAPTVQPRGGGGNSALNDDLISSVKEIHTVTGLRLLNESDQMHEEAMKQDGNGQIQNKPNESRVSAKGKLESNTKVNVSHEEEPAVKISSNDLATNISRSTKRRSAYIANDPVEITNKTIKPRSSSRGGRNSKEVKEVPTESRPSMSRGRGRRSAPLSRRGRGK